MRFDSSRGLGGREKKKCEGEKTEQVGKGVGVGSREDSFLHRQSPRSFHGPLNAHCALQGQPRIRRFNTSLPVVKRNQRSIQKGRANLYQTIYFTAIVGDRSPTAKKKKNSSSQIMMVSGSVRTVKNLAQTTRKKVYFYTPPTLRQDIIFLIHGRSLALQGGKAVSLLKKENKKIPQQLYKHLDKFATVFYTTTTNINNNTSTSPLSLSSSP